MSVQIQLRRGTATQWTTANPILAIGEMGVEIGPSLPYQFKIGNGTQAWNDLPYGGLSGASGDPLQVEMITLDSTMISNKELSLLHAVTSPAETLVFLDGGSVQKYGIDFTVSSNILSWDGLGLETIINVNDVLILQYKY